MHLVKVDKHFIHLILGFFFHLALAITLRWYTNLGLWGLAILIISVLIWMTAGIIALTKETKLDDLKVSLDKITGTWEHPPRYWLVLDELNDFERRKQPFRGFGTVNKRSR